MAPAGDNEEVVPGMAEHVERRRRACGLSPGQFAVAAGATPQGVSPIRKGYRRQYQDRLKLGVARALRWPDDAVDRLLAGENPAEWDEPEPEPPPAVLQIAALAGNLTDSQRAKVEGYIRALLDADE